MSSISNNMPKPDCLLEHPNCNLLSQKILPEIKVIIVCRPTYEISSQRRQFNSPTHVYGHFTHNGLMKVWDICFLHYHLIAKPFIPELVISSRLKLRWMPQRQTDGGRELRLDWEMVRFFHWNMMSSSTNFPQLIFQGTKPRNSAKHSQTAHKSIIHCPQKSFSNDIDHNLYKTHGKERPEILQI